MTGGRSLLRFWWVVLIGIAAGVLVALVVYKSESGKKYTGTTRLFVNAPSAPYLRTQQTQVTPQSAKLKAVRTKVRGRSSPTVTLKPVAQPPSVTSAAPDTQTLVNAANLYPLLIESDQIARLRESLYGVTPGKLTANALNASTNTYGVYHPSPLPIIEVKAIAHSRADAGKLAQDTVQTFSKWVAAQQKAAAVPAAQRIAVQELQTPVLTSSGGPSKGLPLFIGALIVLAACGLAVLFDRARPAGAGAPAAAETPPGTAASATLDT
jgi:hypothetical protein